MKNHRGATLEKSLYAWAIKHGQPITKISKLAGYNPSSTYRHFTKENLPFHIIARYGNGLAHDFRKEFPDMEEMDMYNIGSKTTSGL